jgi:hypothetical protein
MPPTSQDFETDCRVALDGLRATLIELYASVGADPMKPQDASRRFGVNKTLTWNIAKVIEGTDPIPTLQNVPGTSAIGQLLSAMEKAGANADAVSRVRAAAEDLDQAAKIHFGDRATLDLIIDGARPDSSDHLERSRKLAFRGNSGLWGVQAKVRLMTVFLAPNPTQPDRLDMAIVRGFIGLRRLRSEVRWPIFHLRGWGGEDQRMQASEWQPLETVPEGERPTPLLRRFGNVDPTDIEEVRNAAGLNSLLAPGPIGNTAAVDCYVADCARAAAAIHATDQDSTGEFGATISAPTERLIFDIVAHESAAFALSPEVRSFAGLFMSPAEDSEPDDLIPIPMPQGTVPLPGSPPALTTPHIPHYAELGAFVHERMGWNPSEFRGCRLEVSHPPMGSSILLRFKLPEA